MERTRLKWKYPLAMFLVGMLGFSLGLLLCYPITYAADALDVRREYAAWSVAVAGMLLLWLNRRLRRPSVVAGPKTPSRRFRFGLRSLFVLVTLAAIWCAYSMNWIRERREALESNSASPLEILWFPVEPRKPLAPAGLWLFGETGERSLLVEKEDEERLRRLFPEAAIAIKTR